MDRNTLINSAKLLQSKEDLLDLLNKMKQDEMDKMGIGDSFYPFTIRHLNYYCNPNNAFHRYKQFEIKKKSGGTRQITAPKNRSFKIMLHYVNEILKALYTPSNYAMGFTENRSVVTNANVHKGQNYVLNLDLKDFFPSIHQARVWKRLQLQPFSFSQPIANLLAGLCSMKTNNNKGEIEYVLPQGAPTSPIITNMICDKLDRRLAGLAKRFGIRYTRYADDITFSSMHNVYQQGGKFYTELERIITDQRFTINENKTRLQKKGARQEVTGIIVSDKLNVNRKYTRDLRNILYIWERYGYSSAFNKFYPKYKMEKGHVKKWTPDLVNVIDGKLMYLKMVKGEEDSVYKSLYYKFMQLKSSLQGSKNSKDISIIHTETLPLLQFEQQNNTDVTIKISHSNKSNSLFDTPEEGLLERKIIESLNTPHRHASFKLGGKTQYALVAKELTAKQVTQKDTLNISFCVNAQGKRFWLVHHKDKKLIVKQKAELSSNTNQKINIDDLNHDLDSLLN